MALETTTILRSVLFHIKTAKTLKAAEIAIQNMCQSDDVAAVEKMVKEYEKEIGADKP